MEEKYIVDRIEETYVVCENQLTGNLENIKKPVVHLSTSSKSLRMKKLNQEKPTPPSTQQFKLAHFYFPFSYVKNTL